MPVNTKKTNFTVNGIIHDEMSEIKYSNSRFFSFIEPGAILQEI